MNRMALRGRPRSFDRDEALEHAMLAFWRYGYDTTSLAELTQAMGITPPSLYAAFGDKEALFLEAVRRYGETDGAYAERALTEEPTAYAAVDRLLRDAATVFANPARPRGCLVISAATNCTPRSDAVQAALRDLRRAGERAIADRIAQGIALGELPPTTDPGELAKYVAAVVQGMSQLARDGADADQLRLVAETSIRAWPAAPPPLPLSCQDSRAGQRKRTTASGTDLARGVYEP
jgi:AcrR family transcriptional regulator